MNEQDTILTLPVNYLRYMEWHKLSNQKSKRVDTPIFGNYPKPRFELSNEDIPILSPGLRSRAIGSHTLVESEYGELVLNVDYNYISRFLELIDGSSTIREIIYLVQHQRFEIDFDVVNNMIGTAIVVPNIIEELNSTISWLSIVRYPQSPYHIVRNYWKNMKDVRLEIEVYLSQPQKNDLLKQLKCFHITTLMGSDLSTFYKPDSPVSDDAVWPGHFRSREAYVGFPGIEASSYLRAIAQSLDIILEYPFETRWEESGLYWGFGSVTEDFLTYRPPNAPFEYQLEHLVSLLNALPSTVIEAELPKAISDLAKFHQRFVQLHPFECANQSLAMNIVNYFLMNWCGTSIPHLNLDVVSLFLSSEDYSRYFVRAVKYYSIKLTDTQYYYPNPNFKNRFEKMRQAFPFLVEKIQSKSLTKFLNDYPDEARNLILVD